MPCLHLWWVNKALARVKWSHKDICMIQKVMAHQIGCTGFCTQYWPRLNSRDCQVVAASKAQDLASVAERGTHHDGLVAKLLVVVVDLRDRDDTCIEME